MKKILAFLLALTMLATIAVPVFADTTVYATVASGIDDQNNRLNATFDGSLDSIFTVDSGGTWRDPAETRVFTWTLSKAYDLTAVQVVWASGWGLGSAESAPTDYTLLLSTDNGASFQKMKTATGCTPAIGSTYAGKANMVSHEDVFEKTQEGVTHVRIEAKGFKSGYASIAEVYFATDEEPAIEPPVVEPPVVEPPVIEASDALIERVECARELSENFPLEATLDGNPDTYWWSSYWENGQSVITDPLTEPIDIILKEPTVVDELIITWGCAYNGNYIRNDTQGHRYYSKNYAIWVSPTYDGDDFVRVEHVGWLRNDDNYTKGNRYRKTVRNSNVDTSKLTGIDGKICRIRLTVPPESVQKNMGGHVAIAEIDVTEGVMPGDANRDGNISLKDMVSTLWYIINGYDIDTKAADVDGDGKIHVRDVIAMAQHLAGGYDVTLKPYNSQERPERFEVDGITYYNVAVTPDGKVLGDNDDHYFPEGEEGYYIQDDIYEVTPDTFDRLVNTPLLGNGGFKIANWIRGNYTAGDTHMFDGVITAEHIDDPLFVSMNSPNEAHNYRGNRYGGYAQQNGDVLVEAKEKHVRVIPIGAVYLNNDCTLPNDTTFTLCFSSMTAAVKFAGGDWTLVNDLEKPALINELYPLPWQLEWGNPPVPIMKAPLGDAKKVDDHWEITLSVGDFRPKEGDNADLVGRVLHFWGENYQFPDGKTGADLEGVAVNYTVWVKEPECAGILSADTGADMRDANGNVDQAFATKSFLVTNEPRSIYGHNVCPQCYDTVMDSAAVQDLLGIQ